jgi:hypothetical protein
MRSSSVSAPIPTRYAGCHFRSRLEARWAVFFDTLGVRWEYEPQGFKIGWYEQRWMYLPDFYLTDLGIWVEVKGSEAQINYDMILAAVVPHDGLPLDPSGTPVPDPSRIGDRMLILGPVPKPPTSMQSHCLLRFRKGEVFQDHVAFRGPQELQRRHFRKRQNNGNDTIFGDDCQGVYPVNTFRPLTATITAPPCDPPCDSYHYPFHPPTTVVRAYTAALSARFEHGQSGA